LLLKAALGPKKDAEKWRRLEKRLRMRRWKKVKDKYL
jgi:hypothetical protein